jgi:hypothetical protein
MTVRVIWSRGGEALLESIAADAIVLTSTVPSPPGSRIEATIAPPGAGLLRLKVHACRRLPEPAAAFRIEGRPIDLKRDLRVFLKDSLRKPERSEGAPPKPERSEGAPPKPERSEGAPPKPIAATRSK